MNSLFGCPSVPVSPRGDSYGRYLVRMSEMHQSVRLIAYAAGALALTRPRRAAPEFLPAFSGSMEALIGHFKNRLDPVCSAPQFCYSSVEAPKGEFGVFVWHSTEGSPYRCRLRAPGFAHLQGLSFMAVGHLLADAVTIIGTQDIVFGEVDR